jgi:hypothetical protein
MRRRLAPLLWAGGITGLAMCAGYYTNTDHAILQWLARIASAPAMPAFFAFWIFGPSIEGIPTGINNVHIAIATFVLWWCIIELVRAWRDGLF